jgi:NAD(P)H-nitrite reductase large subunit
MQPDDELCLCFHVTKRKVVNFVRIAKPRTAAQLADCYGAGTGCGWCRPFLKQIFDTAQDTIASGAAELPSADEYAKRRTAYVRAGKGTPPQGATPIHDETSESDVNHINQ